MCLILWIIKNVKVTEKLLNMTTYVFHGTTRDALEMSKLF